MLLCEWSDKMFVFQADRQIKMKRTYMSGLPIRRDARKLISTATGRLFFVNKDEFIIDFTTVNIFESEEYSDFYFNLSEKILLLPGEWRIYHEWN